jgi:hypothetical protein
MAVIVKYVVERNGVEKMTFAAKSEADAYDKMLDMADDLFSLLAQSQLVADEQQQEQLAFYLAQHKDELLQALGAKAKTAKKEKNEQSSDSAHAETATTGNDAEQTALAGAVVTENTVTLLNQRQHQAA